MSFVNKASNSSILGIVATSFCCAAEDFFLLCIRSLERARSWLLVVLRCWWGEEWAHARIPPVASFDGVMPSSGEWGLLGGTKRYKWVEIKSRKSSTYYYVRSYLPIWFLHYTTRKECSITLSNFYKRCLFLHDRYVQKMRNAFLSTSFTRCF